MSTQLPLLEVDDLCLGYVSGARLLTAVDGISFSVAAGETFALLGESGCGKSATAQGIMRLLPTAGRIARGRVRFSGEDLLSLPEAAMRAHRGRSLAMIFQEPATSLNPVLSVGEQIAEVLSRHLGLTGDAAQARMQELLTQVGIADVARRLKEYPFQFSGGMKQRVMIAMALAGEPRLLIADEPSTALDVTVQAQILDLLKGIQAERGMGILLITHDLGVVARMADRIGVMYAGELVEMAPSCAFFAQTPGERHPYTRALFAALPDQNRRGAPLLALPGQVPALDAMPQGCRFADRCPLVMPVCRTVSPPWRAVGPKHRLRCHWQGAAETLQPGEAPPAEMAAAGQAALLEVRDLQVHFPIRRGLLQRTVGFVRAVDGVNLSLAAGRTLALVGESGCGKTTVGKAILQLVQPTGGEVHLGGQALVGARGRALRAARRRLQMIFQDPYASLNPRLRIGEIIHEGIAALAAAGNGPPEKTIAALIGQVGLPVDALLRFPHEFSGGQRQRIAIARALAVRPEVLVCDEPTSALDVSVQAQILNLLKALQAEMGMAYLFITHNFAVVEYLAHEVAVMYLGRIVESGPVDQVLKAPRHPYTQALLSAVLQPRLDGGGQVIRLTGEIPSPAQPPAGCHFHPRCPHAFAACRVSYPSMTALGDGQQVACHLMNKGE